MIIFEVNLKNIKKLKKLLNGWFKIEDKRETKVIFNIQIQQLFDKKLAIDQL